MQLMEVHNMGLSKLSKFARKLLDKDGGINIKYFLPTGNQYCPYCHVMTAHRPEGYYECEICNYSITDEEAADGDGYHTLESTYEEEIYTYDIDEDYRKPVECINCDGPYPDCKSTCYLLSDDDDDDYCAYDD